MNLDFLDETKKRLIKNYTLLITKVDKIDKKEIENVLRFCSLFQSDDIELYKRFEKSRKLSGDIVDIYARMHGLNSEKNIEEIMYAFVQNSINEGVCYHLNSSANTETILGLGLGISAIGKKTEEREDYEKLEELVGKEQMKELQAFHGDKKGAKVYYSNVPIPYATYGDRPEWIKELKLNYSKDMDISQEAKDFIETILEKYDKKYSGKSRSLFILPYLEDNLPKKTLEDCLNNGWTPNMIIDVVTQKLDLRNEYYTGHIPGSEIISVDLENANLYISDREGGIITINPQEQVKEYESQEIKLSSEYEMERVFIGNTGQMYEIKDAENGKEYYFKPAISKSGEKRPYRAYIQEAAYKIQKIINPDNAVKCNTIEINGMFGAIQEKIPIDIEATKTFKKYFNNRDNNLYLSEETLNQILDEYLVDFCLCNYDAHERNFIIDKNGNLRGIDKEQSFRYINEDTARDPMFSTNYNERYGENPPIYNKIFERVKNTFLPINLLNGLTEKANILSKIPDDEYRKIFEQYAYDKCDKTEDAEKLLDNILDRKRSIQKSVEQLRNDIQQERDKIFLDETELTEDEFYESLREFSEVSNEREWDVYFEKYEKIKREHKRSSSEKSDNNDELSKQEGEHQIVEGRKELEKARTKKDILTAEDKELDEKLARLKKDSEYSDNHIVSNSKRLSKEDELEEK